MGQNNNEGKINLVQLVLLGLGSLIGSGWLFVHGKLLLQLVLQPFYLGLSGL